jgi:hypothetical protein
MTDYQPLIARAIEGLGKSTGEARRALYERARSALVAQLRSAEPALSETEITKERLALEEAIRKVEADAARKSRLEPRAESRFEPRPLRPPTRPPAAAAAPPPPPPPSPPEPAPSPQAAADPPPGRREPRWYDEPTARPPSPHPGLDQPPLLPRGQSPPRPPSPARNQPTGVRPTSLDEEHAKDFGAADSANSFDPPPARGPAPPRPPRGPFAPPPRRTGPREGVAPPPPPSRRDPFRAGRNGDGFGGGQAAQLQPESLEPRYSLDDEPMLPASAMRPHAALPPIPEEDYEAPRPPRSYRGLITLAIAAVVVGALAAVVSWQWPNITHMVAQFRSKPAPQVAQTPAAQPKLPDRVPQQQQQGQGQQPAAGPATNQAPPAVAQRVVLYEEDPNDPQGKRFAGSAIWRTETVSPGPGLPPELAVRADIEVPERHMTVTWSLRRNTDKALPASHTIEIMFNLPADFPGGGIANVPGILMKQAEQARGTPLAGLAVKVTNGYFLIGLSAVDADRQRNLQLLKDQEWFDIPIVYSNGGRAILAVEKGPPGDKAFADALAAWSK